MTQLVYHPAFDPYNALLRNCRVLLKNEGGLDPMALRILEFYLLFPEELPKIRLSASLRSAIRKLDPKPRYPYDRLPLPRTVFDRMASSFEAALQTMKTRRLVMQVGTSASLRLSPEKTPQELLELARKQNEEETTLLDILAALAQEFPTFGPNGLKDRSGLAEFRYDAV